jgi:hypothetical protein
MKYRVLDLTGLKVSIMCLSIDSRFRVEFKRGILLTVSRYCFGELMLKGVNAFFLERVESGSF